MRVQTIKFRRNGRFSDNMKASNLHVLPKSNMKALTVNGVPALFNMKTKELFLLDEIDLFHNVNMKGNK